MFVRCPRCGRKVDGPPSGSATCLGCQHSFSVHAFLEPEERPFLGRMSATVGTMKRLGVTGFSSPREGQQDPVAEPLSSPAADSQSGVPIGELVDEEETMAGVRLPAGFEILRPFVGCLFLVGLGLYIVLLFLMVLTLLAGLTFVPNGILGAPGHAEYLFLLIPFAVPIVGMTGATLVAWYLILVLSVLASYALLIRQDGWSTPALFLQGLRKLRGPSRLAPNGFVLLAGFFLATLFFDVLWYDVIVARLFQSNPNIPPFSQQQDWELYLGFLHASVWEEIAGRVVLIGLPLLAIEGLRPRLGPDGVPVPPAPGLPGVLRHLFGGQGTISGTGVIWILVSSLVFGIAHAPAWDAWKIVPALVSGLGFGYLYLKKGLHLAILYHFSFDYYGLTFDRLLGPSTAGTGVAITAAWLLVFVWLAVGAVLLVLYSLDMARYLRRHLDPIVQGSLVPMGLPRAFGLPPAGDGGAPAPRDKDGR